MYKEATVAPNVGYGGVCLAGVWSKAVSCDFSRREEASQ
jgi:hypothetical protein